MFGVDSSELFLIVLVAVVVIGPKDLPRVMRTVGHWVGKARGMASQFRLGVDQMMRETEIAELEKKWREQNEAIMKAHPMAPMDSDWGKPAPAAEPAAIAEAEPLTAAPVLEKASKPAFVPAPEPPQLTKHVPPAVAPVEAQQQRPGRRAPRIAPERP